MGLTYLMLACRWLSACNCVKIIRINLKVLLCILIIVYEELRLGIELLVVLLDLH